MQPHGKSDTGVDAGRNHTALKIAEPARSRVRSLAARGLAAAVLVFFAALLALPLQAQAQTEVWSGTLTVRDLGFSLLGCSNSVATSNCSSRLTDDDFTHDSTDYAIEIIFLRSNGSLEIEFDTDLTTATQGLILNVDGTDFAFEDADSKLAAVRVWFTSGQSWSAGDTVSLTLTEPADATLSDLVLEDNAGTEINLTPTFVTGTTRYTASVASSVSAITLTPTVNDASATVEYLNASNAAITDTDTTTPALDAPLVVGANTFKVKVTAGNTTPTTETYRVVVTRAPDTTLPTLSSAEVREAGEKLILTFSEGLDIATELLPAAVVGAFSVTADGLDVAISTVTGSAAENKLAINLPSRAKIEQGQTVTVSYDKSAAGSDALEDDAGNEVATFTDFAVTNNSTQAPTAPGAPTALMADGSSETQIDLSWTAPADNGGATISGYRIEVSADGGTTWTDLDANTGTTGTTYSHTGLAAGTTRDYRVSAINSVGTGAASDSVSATTPLSTNVTLSGLALKDASDDSTIDLNETFAATTKFYTADVATDVDEITVEPTSDHNATFAYLNDSDTALTDADTNTTGFQVALAVGANTVKVKVTAEDGSANETYSVVVTRAAAGNTAATGKPSITGAAQAGMTLEADLGDIADADDLPTSGYMYQWISGGSAILGATGSSLTLGTSNYNGQKFRVRVSFTDDAGYPESRTSDETLPVAPSAAACPTDAATVWCATLTVGHLLAEEDGFIDVSAAGYEARSDRMAFGSVTGSTSFRHLGIDYTVTAMYGGGQQTLTLATTPNLPSDGAGLTAHVQTYGGEVDAPVADALFVSGLQHWQFVQVLFVAPGGALSDVPLLRGQFSRGARVGAPPDLGTRVRVRLSYAAPTGPATGKPKITGTAQVGRTLTAGTSGISDPDGNMKAENGDAGFAYTYQWYRVDAGAETEITGAQGRVSTYTLVQADEGKTFRVEVHFTDDADNDEGPLKSNEYPAGAENGELRLEGGANALEGRLEVFHNGEWGTVCDDRLDNAGNIAPALACRFMGYANGKWVPRGDIANMSVAPASQRIWLDDVRCHLGSNHWTGATPSKLHHCYHAGWGLNNCTHDEDVHLRCVEGLGMQTEATGLTASIEDAPTNHDGTNPFTFRIAFSAEVEITPEDMRDHALVVSGGTVTAAAQVDGRKDLWELTVEPAGSGPVSVLAPQNRACTEAGALCTAAGAMLSTGLGRSVPGPAQGQQGLAPLTAGFTSVPAEHDGQTEFWLELTFDAAVAQGSKSRIRALLGVTGGSETRIRRKDGRLDHWRIKIQPSSHEAVTVTLSPSPPCGAAGAVCTEDGRTYTTALATQIQGPPGLTVADAEVEEGPNAVLRFAVTLSRAPSGTVTVDYATADGTATAGSDYTAVNGALTIAAGEREKTVSVPVLDDAHDEGSETLTLSLSNASGAYIEDGTATGTINNTDHMPKAWLARFGRTVAEQVLDAVGARVEGNSNSPGPAQLTLGGHQVVLDASWRRAEDTLLEEAGVLGQDLRETRDLLRAEADASPAREVSTAGLLMASSFHMASAGGEGEDESARWSLWARGSRSSFSGREDALTLEGDVSTGVMGADYERGRVLAGVALAYSAGEGSYTEADARGEVESTLLSVYPYLRYTLSERLSVWSVLGLGEGGLTLDVERNDERIETDISLAMAAFGARGKLASVAGYDLAVKTDVLFVRTESEAAAGLAAADARTRRLRLTLEGSREVKFESGVLTPFLEVGLRHDGGDAETGSGLELGGGLRWAGLKGFAVEVRARGLLAHEESDYEEWGVSASIGLSPGEGDRGLSMRVGSVWGAASGGVERLWSQRALAGSSFDPDARLEAEVGYGLGAMRGLLTPYTGLSLSESGETWRAGARFRFGPALELNLEASLTEPDGDGEPASGLVLRGTKRW